MERTFNLNELAEITGYTTRSLRAFVKTGLLEGEKAEGAWRFTEEQIQAFLNQPGMRQSVESKRNAVVFDFLADSRKTQNRACVILDFAVDAAEARRINAFFCARMKEAQGVEYRFSWERGLARVILSGGEDSVSDMMKAYYEGK